MSLQRSPPNKMFSSQPNINLLEDDDSVSRVNTRKRKTPENDNFSEFRQEIKELFNEFQTRQDGKLDNVSKAIEALIAQNSKLIKTNSEIEKMLNESKEQQNKLQEKVKKLETECVIAHSKINSLEDQLQDMQKNQLKKVIEVRNVPRQDNENLQNIVMSMMTAINFDRNTVNIKDVYRRGVDNAPITVELMNFEQKINILKAVKVFNNKNKGDKLNTNHLGLNVPRMPIYVSEMLTTRTKMILSSAKKLVKDGYFKYCWVSKGAVLLRKEDGQPPVIIKKPEDIDAIKSEPKN